MQRRQAQPLPQAGAYTRVGAFCKLAAGMLSALLT